MFIFNRNILSLKNYKVVSVLNSKKKQFPKIENLVFFPEFCQL